MKNHRTSVSRRGIIAWFDRRRFWDNSRNPLLDRLRLYGLWNRAVDLSANILLPLYFKVANRKPSIHVMSDLVRDDLVVSLTSFPARINKVWLTVESLLRQTILPAHIILYLSKEQFPKAYNSLPHTLLSLRSRGLEIRFVDGDLRSHKKYFYAMQEYPDHCVVTVDDDMLYPSDMLETLYAGHLNYPDAVVGNRGKKIYRTIPRYEHWPALRDPYYSDDLLFVGCSGILYPPGCLHADAFRQDLIKALAFTADDIWLSCMARLNHTPMYFTGYRYNHLPVIILGNSTLYDVNAAGANQSVVEALNTWYREKTGLRPFVDMVDN